MASSKKFQQLRHPKVQDLHGSSLPRIGELAKWPSFTPPCPQRRAKQCPPDRCSAGRSLAVCPVPEKWTPQGLFRGVEALGLQNSTKMCWCPLPDFLTFTTFSEANYSILAETISSFRLSHEQNMWFPPGEPNKILVCPPPPFYFAGEGDRGPN